MKKYIYGFDIGGTTVKIGLFNPSGDILDKWEITTDLTDKGTHILEDIYKAIKSHQVKLDDILGYGFGVPGPVLNGLVLKGINIGWDNYNIITEFSKLTNNDLVFVENDANVAALGEAWQGAAKGYKNSIMITIGTGDNTWAAGDIVSDYSSAFFLKGYTLKIDDKTLVEQGELKLK